MKLFERAFGRVTSFASFISFLATVAMMLVVAADVVSSLFGRPVPGVGEITVMLMVVLVFLGIPQCAMDDEMIKVDIVHPYRSLGHFANVLYMIMGLIITWQTVLQARHSYRLHEVSSLLRIPNWPFIVTVAVGFFLMAIAAAVLEYRFVNEGRAGSEKWFRDENGGTHSVE